MGPDRPRRWIPLLVGDRGKDFLLRGRTALRDLLLLRIPGVGTAVWFRVNLAELDKRKAGAWQMESDGVSFVSLLAVGTVIMA